MIRFFRSIRQRLLAQGRITRYLTYALGEIVLVMIGILLALQINDWNEQRKLRTAEIKLLRNFESSLESDVESFVEYIEEYRTIHRSIRLLMTHMKADLPYHDSLDFHFLNSTAYWSPRVGQELFSTITSTDLNNISNDSLKKEIISYYTFAKTDFDMKIAKYSAVIDNASLQLFNTRFDGLWNVNDRAMIPHDYETLKRDKPYNYFLASLDQQIYWLVESPLKQAKGRAEKLLRMIDEDLKRLEQ